MALKSQVHIYSVDTGAFYTNNEKRLHWRLCTLKKEKEKINSDIKNNCYHEILTDLIDNKDDYKSLMKAEAVDIINHNIELSISLSDERYAELIPIILKYKSLLLYKKHKIGLINKTKNRLLSKLKESVEHNNNAFDKRVRCLRKEAITDRNIISVFDSSLTRMLGVKENDLTTDIMVVKVFYFDILKDLIKNGFRYNGEKYRFFTASAGQIRTKKTVFIKESKWNQYEKTLMCGLTIDSINQKGGINVNKYLAYLALSNSATDVWTDFDINKCIVVDDFETLVSGIVDFIDDKTYTIERKLMDIPITHTDGCGMVLPSLSKKNFMVRLPWVKGLLASYPYDKFIQQANKAHPEVNHGIIKDIYGKEYDILKDNIQIIFTKSQFKMSKYYSNWDEYIEYFKDYKCQAGICNLEEDHIKNATINYQMIQTLCDMTQQELFALTRRSRKKLDRISSTVKSMLEVFGVTKYNKNKTYLQQALEIYPELLNDTYTKNILRGIKQSLVNDYKSAKLEINGKYTFLIPDLYAACEYWFLNNKNPNGLLKNGEVSCRLYPKYKKLDCLRSPHLYREHALRDNVTNSSLSEWFDTDAIYTSCHDLISKILQFDNDGDKSLVVSDENLISVVERHLDNVFPLYYEMKKADPVLLDGDKIYNGLNAAYTGGNIGAISNDITKIWNSCSIDEDALKAIKILCMENNFTIDYAKTLYKPSRPKEVNELIKTYTKAKVPYFFVYAKNKKNSQVEPINDSVVNRLNDMIIDNRLRFSLKEFGKVDYILLMHNPKISVDAGVILEYSKLNRKYHYQTNMEDCNSDNRKYIANDIKWSMSQTGFSDSDITDMLVKQLYGLKHSKSKESLWFCYGDIILENLKKNIENKTSVCQHCGKRFEKENEWQEYCNDCKGYQKAGVVKRKCIDCHKHFNIDARNAKKKRCDECQKKHRKEWDRERKNKLNSTFVLK